MRERVVFRAANPPSNITYVKRLASFIHRVSISTYLETELVRGVDGLLAHGGDGSTEGGHLLPHLNRRLQQLNRVVAIKKKEVR